MRNEEDVKYLKKFGENVKTIRISKGFTQQYLADSLNVEISQISRLERGILNTSIINIKNIAVALQVDAGDLFKFQ
ncbi:helix-turn-helix domain-containing protein [Flavobacterium sp. FlaQc-28]|uniref:helix-turn-helix domain-containing protein n=1 Tax=Flavobacterium sp. FlaQc-28 TaxID=3374178 RepID=UPI003757DAC3